MNPNDQLRSAIAVLRQKVDEQEAAARRTKEMVNQLCADIGEPEIYPAESLKAQASGAALRGDEYYGQALSTAVRAVLESRRAINLGPATVGEIYDALTEGGYAFDAKNDENAKRGLRISLTKNSATFHKLPNGSYGLLEWYPAAKQAKGSKAEDDSTAQADPATEEVAEEPAEKGGES